MMVCPKLAPLLGCSLFLTVVWRHTDVRTTLTHLPDFCQLSHKGFFDPSFLACFLCFWVLLSPGSRHLFSDSQSCCRDARLPLTAFSCQIHLYSLFIFLVFGNPVACAFSIFWWVQLPFSWVPIPLLHFSSLGDQTSVFLLTVSLALVFHSLN